MAKHIQWICVFAVVLLCFGTAAFAQISGDVLVQTADQSGGVVPNATVTLKSIQTGASRTATTDANGAARFAQLGVGDYEVKVDAAGFASFTTRATVTSGNVATVPVTLNIKAAEQQVLVTDAAAPVNTVNAQLQQTTETAGLESLPIAGQGPLALAGISPGVIPVTPRNPFLGLGSFNDNGGRGRGNNITLDSANATDVSTTGAAGLNTVPLDAVQEFNIITNNFQAQYGRNADAQVQILTKGGTNEFHGDLFEFFRNDKLNARDYFDRTGHPSIERNNDWGAVGGFPVIKNKLFGFATYEQQKIRGAGGTRIATVLTSAQAASVTDPTAKALLQQLQIPNSPTGTVSEAAPNSSNFYAYSARGDWNITDRDVFYARYGRSHAITSSPGLTFIDSSLPGNGASSANIPYNATVSETHTFGPTLVNQLLFAFGRSAPVFTPLSSAGGPEIQFNDGTSFFGTSNILPQGRVQNTYFVDESATWNKGRHQFKFGAQFDRVQANSFFDANTHGTFVFQTLNDFLTGNPFTYTQRFGNSVRGNRVLNQYYYAQDDFKVMRNLTINVGLRLEIGGPVSEINNIISNLNLHGTAPLGAAGTGPLGSFDVGQNANYFHRNYNWGPVAGFAWNPRGGKTVIRGGYRIAYDFIFLNPITNGRFLPPFMYNLSLPNGSFTGANSFANVVAGSSAFQQQGHALVGTFGTNILNFGGISPIDQNLRNPQVQQYSLTVEREVWGGILLRGSYVGTKGNYLPRGRPINTIAPGQFVIPQTLAQQQAEQAAGTFAAVNAALNAGPSQRSNRIDPRFDGITLVESSANSNYNAFQFYLAKRFSGSYSFTAAYTWSKSIDDNSDVLGVLENDTPNQQNPFDNRNNRAVSEFDSPHRVVITHLFTPQRFKTSPNRLERWFLGGWEFSGIFQAQSGFPINFFSGAAAGLTDPSLIGGGNAIRPDLVGPLVLHLSPNPGGKTIQNKVTGSGLAQPLVGHFGTIGRNVFRENPLIQSDMTFGKRFKINERMATQFQAQIFNIFNNTTFSRPGVTLSAPSTFGYYQDTDTNSRNITLTARFIC